MSNTLKALGLLDELATYLRDTEECECDDEGTCTFCVAGDAQELLAKIRQAESSKEKK